MLIKQLEDNLRIAEAEGDHQGARRIRQSLNMLLNKHIHRAEKLFLPEQPSNIEYHVIRQRENATQQPSLR